MLKVKKVLMLGLVFAAHGAYSSFIKPESNMNKYEIMKRLDRQKKPKEICLTINGLSLVASAIASLPILEKFSHGTPSEKAAVAFIFVYFNMSMLILPFVFTCSPRVQQALRKFGE